MDIPSLAFTVRHRRSGVGFNRDMSVFFQGSVATHFNRAGSDGPTQLQHCWRSCNVKMQWDHLLEISHVPDCGSVAYLHLHGTAVEFARYSFDRQTGTIQICSDKRDRSVSKTAYDKRGDGLLSRDNVVEFDNRRLHGDDFSGKRRQAIGQISKPYHDCQARQRRGSIEDTQGPRQGPKLTTPPP